MLARTLFVCFVLLTLPFQGYAAAAMACAHGAAGLAPAAAHHGGDATPPCHEAAHKQAHQPAHGEDDGGQGGHTSCSSCSVCSVGAAIAPACIDSAGHGHPRGPCPSCSPARIAAFDPDLPERPPRPHLA